MQQRAQNAFANQILNTQNPPRAGLVAPGVNPVTGAANVIRPGTPTMGTPPQTGGMGELTMRQQMAQQDLADNLKRAQIAEHLARTQNLVGARTPSGQGSAARWQANLGAGGQVGAKGAQGGKGGKPAPYVAGSGNVQGDSATDNFNQIQTDFDAQHGAGSFNAFTKNYANLIDDGKGNLVVGKPDPDHPDKTIPATDKNGLPLFSIPKSDAPFWMQRYNAARIRAGQGYLGNLPDGVNPSSGQPSGTQVNPIDVPDNLTLRSLPMGTWMRMQDGSIRQKNPQPVQSQAAPTQAAASDQTSDQTITSDEDKAAQAEVEKEDTGDQTDQSDETENATSAAGQGTGAQSALAGSSDTGAQSDDEQRKRQAALALAMNQPAGAGNLYPAQDIFA